MKSSELLPSYDNLRKTFVNDTIGRSADVIRFASMLNVIDSNFSIALDSSWGSGKTFFVKQVKMSWMQITTMFIRSRNRISRFFKANGLIFPENRCLTFSRKFACIMMHGRMTAMRIRFWNHQWCWVRLLPSQRRRLHKNSIYCSGFVYRKKLDSGNWCAPRRRSSCGNKKSKKHWGRDKKLSWLYFWWLGKQESVVSFGRWEENMSKNDEKRR